MNQCDGCHAGARLVAGMHVTADGHPIMVCQRHRYPPYPQENHMTFSEALTLIKNGKRLTRAGWNGANAFIFLVPGSTFTVNRAPLLGIYPEGTEINYHAHIDMRTAKGQIVPWLASQADLLTDDWMVVA